jgi:hypothetical protein
VGSHEPVLQLADCALGDGHLRFARHLAFGRHWSLGGGEGEKLKTEILKAEMRVDGVQYSEVSLRVRIQRQVGARRRGANTEIGRWNRGLRRRCPTPVVALQ